jgi:hypothetical protein
METQKNSLFIKKLDKYLLKDHPVIWSTRIHTAGIYGLGFAFFIALISFIVPNDPRNGSMVHYWITLVSIVSLLAFVFWMIYLLRFNVFKRFGIWKGTDTVKTFILYFLITLIIISWPFIPPIIESVRANGTYTTEELVKDINNMNIKLCQLERDSIDRRFDYDSFLVRNKTKETVVAASQAPAVETVIDLPYAPTKEHYFIIDTTELKGKLLYSDSIMKLNDSLYIVYTCPEYKFIYEYNVDDKGDDRILSSMDLFRQVLQYKQVIDKEKVRNELEQLLRKYDPWHDDLLTLRRKEHPYSTYDEYSFMTRIRDKYGLYPVNHNLDNITDKMYRWDEGTINICWHLAYYFTLCLSMLVLIYRHTTRKTFFLSLLVAVVLTILTSLFIAFSPGETVFFIWIIVYFIIFILLSAFIFSSKHRNVFSGIGFNLLVFLTPFMPLVITALYYESLHRKYQYSEDLLKYGHLFENEQYHYFLSEIGGALLLILLLATLYQQAYRKWFASPAL